MLELPPRQAEAVEVVRRFTDEYRYPPTIAEVAQIMRVSRSSVRQYFEALEAKGRITRAPATSRSVVVVDDIGTPN